MMRMITRAGVWGLFPKDTCQSRQTSKQRRRFLSSMVLLLSSIICSYRRWYRCINTVTTRIDYTSRTSIVSISVITWRMSSMEWSPTFFTFDKHRLVRLLCVIVSFRDLDYCRSDDPSSLCSMWLSLLLLLLLFVCLFSWYCSFCPLRWNLFSFVDWGGSVAGIHLTDCPEGKESTTTPTTV